MNYYLWRIAPDFGEVTADECFNVPGWFWQHLLGLLGGDLVVVDHHGVVGHGQQRWLAQTAGHLLLELGQLT